MTRSGLWSHTWASHQSSYLSAGRSWPCFFLLAWNLSLVVRVNNITEDKKTSRTGSHQCPVSRLGLHPLSTKYRRPQASLMASLVPSTGLSSLPQSQHYSRTASIKCMWSRSFMGTPAGSGLGSLVGRGVSFSPPGQGAQVPLPTVVSPLPPAGNSLT